MKLFAGQSADLVPVTVSEAKNSPLGIYGVVPDGTQFTGDRRYYTGLRITIGKDSDPSISPISLSATQSSGGTTQFAYGIRPYAEETAQLETNALRIDGEAMYSQARGGIYAEGYMDLQGPAPEDDQALDYEERAVGNGWSKIGDDVTDGAALTAVNAVHSGPAF